MDAAESLDRSLYARETKRRLDANPTDRDALFASASLVAAKREYGRAIELLGLLGELDPKYPGLWRFKARIYREAGNRRMEKRCLILADRQEMGP
jgi:Flp pilus assembly protein TadD